MKTAATCALSCLGLIVPTLSVGLRGFNTLPRRGPGYGGPLTKSVRMPLVCDQAQQGSLPDNLSSSERQVKAACAALRSALQDARDDYGAALRPLQAQMAQARNAWWDACQTIDATDSSCDEAREAFYETVDRLEEQFDHADDVYQDAVRTARREFRHLISDLRSSSSVSFAR